MPEDEDVPEEDEEAEVLSKPRMQARFNDDDDDDHSENGEDIEEEYVSTFGFTTSVNLIMPGVGNRCRRHGNPRRFSPC